MSDLVQLPRGKGKGVPKSGVEARRPEWLRVRIQDSNAFREVGAMLDNLNLNTVCEEARCPNIWECWGKHRTATFMILGDVCTKTCRYCSVGKGKPLPPDAAEPGHVAEAVARLALKHAVITSVDRDDLADFGAGHWAAVIGAVRERNPECRIELLTPDFMADESALRTVLQARPDVFAHNIETVEGLYKRMRPKGSYARALQTLARIDAYRREHGVAMTTKTGVMVGLGETRDELLHLMDDARAAGCDVLTLGQYLNPTQAHAAIDRFYTPEEFAELREQAMSRGFTHCESGPLVRSSYHAHEHVPGVAPSLR